MAHNPLIGNRISLISKKNIRYEGTLYSINEADATVALQNVRSYGTEGREKLTAENGAVAAFVPPQDAVHPYLLFRGCDIKDLHVHENTSAPPPPTDPAIVGTTAPPAPVAAAPAPTANQQKSVESTNEKTPKVSDTSGSKPSRTTATTDRNDSGRKTEAEKDGPGEADTAVSPTDSGAKTEIKQSGAPKTEKPKGKASDEAESSRDNNKFQKGRNEGRGRGNQDYERKQQSNPKSQTRNTGSDSRNGAPRRPRRNNFSQSPAVSHQIGTGASLLNRKARGAVEGAIGPDLDAKSDFDFESKLAEFHSASNEENARSENGNSGRNDETDGIEGGAAATTTVYSKDNFFDSISCDALDKQEGIDNRLRGAEERRLNSETFGAVSLGYNGRRTGRRGRRGGRGGGGRGRGRTGDGPPPRENSRWKRGPSNYSHSGRGGGSRRGQGEFVNAP